MRLMTLRVELALTQDDLTDDDIALLCARGEQALRLAMHQAAAMLAEQDDRLIVRVEDPE